MFFAQYIYVSQFFETLLLGELYLLPKKEDPAFFARIKRFLFIKPSKLINKIENVIHIKKDENIYLSQVQDLNIPLTKSMIDDAIELKNCMICAFWSMKDKQMFDDMYEKSAEAIAYAKEKGIVLYLAHGADKESYQTGLERGFKGFQCTVSDAFLK